MIHPPLQRGWKPISSHRIRREVTEEKKKTDKETDPSLGSVSVSEEQAYCLCLYILYLLFMLVIKPK